MRRFIPAVALAALFLIGCAPSSQISVPANTFKQTSLTPKVYEIPSIDPYSGKEMNIGTDMVDAVIEKMESLNKHPMTRTKHPLFDNTYNVKGADFLHKDGKILARVLNGHHREDLDRGDSTAFFYDLRYEVAKANGKTRLTIYPPANPRVSPGSSMTFQKYELYDSIENMEKDALELYSKLDNKLAVKLYTDINIQGSHTSDYSVDAVYGNFVRTLGGGSGKTIDGAKINSFRLKHKDQTLPLYVEVSPYRTGSKVGYQIRHTLVYQIDEAGKITGTILTPEDEKTIKNMVEKIVTQ